MPFLPLRMRNDDVGEDNVLRALLLLLVVVVVVLRESREDILIMQQLFNSETEGTDPKMDALFPLCVTGTSPIVSNSGDIVG